jgi:hypothetical protein
MAPRLRHHLVHGARPGPSDPHPSILITLSDVADDVADDVDTGVGPSDPHIPGRDLGRYAYGGATDAN